MKKPVLSVLTAWFVLALVLGQASAQRLANLSTRTQVGSGANVTVVGFVVGQGSNKNILIRAVGPTLGAAPFGVPGTISDPKIDVADATGRVIFSNDNWSTTTVGGATTFASLGAFNLATNSRDAAILATNLPPYSYHRRLVQISRRLRFHTRRIAPLESARKSRTATSREINNHKIAYKTRTLFRPPNSKSQQAMR